MGSKEPQSDIPVVDARGLRCPLPVARARSRLATLPVGARLDLLADDPLALLDVQAFCAQEGHAFLGHADLGNGAVRLRLRRGQV